MAINYGLGSRLTTPRTSTSRDTGRSSSGAVTYGRVTDVVVDAFHPLFSEKGNGAALYGIEYLEITSGTDASEDSEKKFAYCGISNIKRLPLKNEAVKLIQGPSSTYRDEGVDLSRTYWVEIVPFWNHVHHNAYPDTAQFGEDAADLGKYFEEKSAINNLQLFPGDLTIESRYGSSIRFSGTKFDSNPFTDSTNNGKPFTLIRNGQAETKDGVDTVLEDINEDKASIYLTSDHKVQLKQANSKRDSFESEPITADEYKGNQVVINSGRLFFNAKEEGVFISATEGIGLNAKEVGIDGEKYVAIDAKKIYLGTNAFREAEPVLRGTATTDWLEDLVKQLETIVKGMSTAPPAPAAYVAKMIATSNSVLPILPVLKQQLRQLHSTKVFTE